MTSDLGNLNYANDGYVWEPPAQVSDGVKNEIARIIPQFNAALAPAPINVVGQWLGQLGMLVAGKISTTDAKQKMAAYAHDLAYPLVCFTDESRRAAAVKFTWFPSFAELTQYLDSIAIPAKQKLDRLRKIAGAKTESQPRGKGWSDLTPAERLAHEAMMNKLKQELAGSEPIPKPLYPAI